MTDPKVELSSKKGFLNFLQSITCALQDILGARTGTNAVTIEWEIAKLLRNL